MKILKVILLFSVGIAIYGLIMYLKNFNDVIGHYKPFWKFFSIKIALFLSIWQEILLKLVKWNDLIKLPEHRGEGDPVTAEMFIDHFLITVEMFVLSIVARYTFSYEDFYQGVKSNRKRAGSAFKSLPKIL